MGFPTERLRRLRGCAGLRRMVRETRLSADDLVMPFFVKPGTGVREPVGSMPGNFRLSVDGLVEACREVAGLGVPAVLLFGIPDKKDRVGSEAWSEEGPVARACRAVKEGVPELVVITDVCLCGYTESGHCGVVQDGRIANDPTLELLSRTALCHARAGADVVAPSDMMDGRVGRIRSTLDAEGFQDTAVLSYAAKYASAYYGPFRDAVQSAPRFGDRRSHQMDPANAREALREVKLDIEEGADIVMVKPALAYLDVIRMVRDRFDVPTGAYNVSGEFAMVKAAAAQGWIDERSVVMETLTAIRRAGADIVITYHAVDAARWLVNE